MNRSEMKMLWPVLGLGLAFLLAGCDKPGITPAATVAGTNAPLKTFETRGVVRSLPESGHSLVVRHEEIPGYMPKMTMELNVRDTNELAGLERNDEITFELVATTDTHWIQKIKRVGKAAINDTAATEGEAPTNSNPGYQLVKELAPGDALPDYELIAEDGRTVHFSDFRGQAVAFTFIFTRCPLPDFCPRMGNNFSAAREMMQTNAPALTNWQFLSVSFDPEFDSPEVLRNYARLYRHENANRWLFVSAPRSVLSKLAPELDLMLAQE